MTTYRDGSLSLKEQSAVAIKQIYEQYQEAFGDFRTKPDIVLVGHSMGGLVSRHILSAPEGDLDYQSIARAKYLRDRTRFIVTLATPHDGSEALDAAFILNDGLDKILDAIADESDPEFAEVMESAFEVARYFIETDVGASPDMTTEQMGQYNRTMLRAENAKRKDGTFIPVYVLGGRQPDLHFYTYKPGLETHTDFKSLPGTIKFIREALSSGNETSRRAKEGLGLMLLDFLVHDNDVSGLLTGVHHPLSGTNVGTRIDWGMVPKGYRSAPPVEELDLVQRTFKTRKLGSIQLKRPLPFEGLFWSKPLARPDEWPVYYWHGRQDGEIDSDGMVSISSSLGMRLGRESVLSELDAWYFDHTRTYELENGRTVRGSWYRIKRGYWDLDNHGVIHRNAHTGRWLWLHLLSKEPGPYTSSGERSSWNKP